ncbi:acyl-CoA thioesterase [Legionella nagasakiensis]|uniref:acyl-CoA thioesterase n=1 Tax=Legionella nagasakiensis TaxID=535290 RepID=UPI001054E89F|nr:thioesterase family protein [Legionella nagasakiensis]
MTEKKIAVHQRIFAISWGDMDALAHVNNGRYFDYFQEARIEWLRALKLDMGQACGPVVIHVACTFLKPVIYPAMLCLNNSIHSLGRSSFIMDHDLYQENVLMAQGTSKLVWINYQENKSVPLPKEIRALFS